MRQSGWRLRVKRATDKVVASAVLVAAAPVMAGAAVAIRATMGGPVLFRQARPGHDGQPFECLKFRTMRTPTHAGEGDEERITRLGRLLRETSIDEFPQFWNVLRGDMSLVGPRPLLTRYMDRYSPEQARRQDVLPGLTGWAQVNGRNTISWDEKFRLDVWYVDHWSLRLDLQIALRSVSSVLKRSDISSDGHATMPEFLGRRPRVDAPPPHG